MTQDLFVHVKHLFWCMWTPNGLIFHVNNWSEQLSGMWTEGSSPSSPWSATSYCLYELSENTDCTINASSICPQAGVWLPISDFPPRPILWYVTSEHSPGCRSRCPGWVLVTRSARARCIGCWLFSINLSRKNRWLARRCKQALLVLHITIEGKPARHGGRQGGSDMEEW